MSKVIKGLFLVIGVILLVVVVTLVVLVTQFSDMPMQPTIPTSTVSVTYDYRDRTWFAIEDLGISPVPRRILGQEKEWEIDGITYVTGTLRYNDQELAYNAYWQNDTLKHLVIADVVYISEEIE